ncbi:transposase [Paenibacillus wuxiensis]|uniref:transposase n=1 Tax=Paenibacillaceae bacterium P-4 TaxID=3160969 RepID=UPI00406B9653
MRSKRRKLVFLIKCLKAANSRIERAHLDEEAGKLIKESFNRRGYQKGSRSIKMILENEFNVTYNLKRIRKLMKKFLTESLIRINL